MDRSYLMLALADEFSVGDVVPNTVDDTPRAVMLVDSARKLQLSELLDDHYDSYGRVEDIASGTAAAPQILRVKPRGVVRLHGSIYSDSTEFDDGIPWERDLLEAEGGWTVTGIESFDAFLGPQAEHIRTAATWARTLDDAETPYTQAYCDAVNRHHDTAGNNVIRMAAHAAEMALSEAGVDDYWWRGTSCMIGDEIIALAARDLIGNTPGWTQDAYDLLTLPWRETMPQPPHPSDASVRAAAR